jgi:transcriptional regulator with XRE-family HTH domain
MSQEKLAEILGLSVPYVSMIEGSQKYPALETLINLANALDVTTDQLLCETLKNEYEIKRSVMLDEISELPKREQERIFTVVRAMIEEAKRK